MKVWIEYGLRILVGSEKRCFRYSSTDDRCHQQMIRFLTAPAEVDEVNYKRTKFECKASLGQRIGVEFHRFDCNVVHEG